ncbi:thymidylate kinase [Caudoviricetes sp.]|nr:thymidylate kinase [Caudoviricetes sp.]
MARISFSQFSSGLPVARENPVTPIADPMERKSGMISRTVSDIPSDVVDTFKGVIGAGRKGAENITEAFTKPGLTVPQRVAGAVVAPFSAVVNAGGEAIKGATKLFTTEEFESTLSSAIANLGEEVMSTDAAKKMVQMYETLPEDQKFTLSNIIAPMTNVMSAGGGATLAKPVIGAAKTGLKGAVATVKETVKRTPQQAANDVVMAANPVANPILDTISGMGTQIKDFAKRTVGEAQDTASEARRFAEMPEPKAKLIKNGADERVINVMEKGTPEEVKIYRELVEQAKKKELDPTPNTPQPKVIAGRELLKPVDYIIKERKSVGAKLGDYRKNLGTAKNIDTNPAFRNFHEHLKTNFGVKFDKDGNIIENTGTLASSDVKLVQKIYDQLRSDKKNSQVELDQWLQRTYKDYDLVQARERTFSEEVPRIADFARSEVRKLMPEDYNKLATDYARLSRPLTDFVKLVGYKGDLNKLTAKELKTAEVALRVLGNAADRPQSVIDDLLDTATEAGYQSNIDLNRLIYVTDQLEDLYDITPSRGFSGSATRGINQSSAAGVVGDAATMNIGGLFNRAMSSRASQKEIQASFEEYLKYLDEGGTPPAKPTSFNEGGTPGKTTFKRDENLSPEYKKIEDSAFKRIEDSEEELLTQYQSLEDTKGGRIINTDSFRRLFTEDGYDGSNAAAVQEPSSYLSKKAYAKALSNPEEMVIFTAGGSGTGKTSALKGIQEISNELDSAAAVVDSNFSSLDSAVTKIKQAEKAGKAVIVDYVYRDPLDSFENGVVARMLNNKTEMGRLVPSKVVAGNHIDSLKVVRQVEEMGIPVNYVDNSLGHGNAKISSFEEINSKANYPSAEELTKQFNTIAKRLLEEGKISQKAYEAYIR